MRYTARHAVLLGFGILMLAGVAARSDEAAGAREQIIQGVRDDVRRKIQERNEMPAESREDVATTGKQPATTAPAHSNTRPEKTDTPK
jgi:hypothetical protein